MTFRKTMFKTPNYTRLSRKRYKEKTRVFESQMAQYYYEVKRAQYWRDLDKLLNRPTILWCWDILHDWVVRRISAFKDKRTKKD